MKLTISLTFSLWSSFVLCKADRENLSTRYKANKVKMAFLRIYNLTNRYV